MTWVDRLVELNVDLAQSATPEERQQIYEEKAASLKVTLASAKLAPDDRELAETLLENSKWLTRNDDPMAAADRFNDIADQFVSRMDAVRRPAREGRKAASSTSPAITSGLPRPAFDPSLCQRAAAAVTDVEAKNKLERTTVRHEGMTKRLAEIVQRNPEPARRAIHRVMKGHKSKK